MPDEFFSTAHLDYLQRNLLELSAPGELRQQGQPPKGTLIRVTGIGHAKENLRQQTPHEDLKEAHPFLPSQDVLTGLHATDTPLAFLVASSQHQVNFCFGSFAAGFEGDPANGVLLSMLRGIYPAVYTEEQSYAAHPAPRAGIVLGIPSVGPRKSLEEATPIDRLVRALTGCRWSILVLAEPIREARSVKLRNGVTNELRRVQAQLQDRKEPSPLGAQYVEMLTQMQKHYSLGVPTGMWRTAAYLMGDEESYVRLAAAWRAIFSGVQSQPQPLRIFDTAYAPDLAARWVLPEEEGDRGPGQFRHAYKYQTLLTSEQLSLYVHLPGFETSGFKSRTIPAFNVVPQTIPVAADTISLGKILSREDSFCEAISPGQFEKLPSILHRVTPDSLTRHVFVAGVTGSGKTTTIMRLLKQSWSLNLPFLVIEPAKTEYRELLTHDDAGTLTKHLQVFTMGEECVAPFRLNPLEVLPGASVARHIDLLRSLFSASFGLWTPLPQILERCLYLVYQEKGWDITGNFNRRQGAGGGDTLAFPTLHDLLRKIDEVASGLKWDPEAVSRIRGSLHDRLLSLTLGGRGRMLDVQTSLPASALFERPTVLELEPMGDDDDKAFIMGLLLIRLLEFRGRSGLSAGRSGHGALQHILVLEEAHRLLTNVPPNAEQGAANPRAKAVETFTNLLSEIRSYGQAVVIADQSPVRLAPDAIKNTNLKIAHRIVDLEDRKVLGGSMVMKDEQVEAVARLMPGTAAVYSEGDDGPLLVQIDPGAAGKRAKPSDDDIHRRFSASTLKTFGEIYQRHEGCANADGHANAACDQASDLAANSVFQGDFTRLVLSLVSDDTALERLWPAVEMHARAVASPGIRLDDLLTCLISRAADWYASSAGAHRDWSWADTRRLSRELRRVLSARTQRDRAAALDAFRDSFHELHKRASMPYAKCAQICPQQECLFREAVIRIKDKHGFPNRWYNAAPFGGSQDAAWSAGQSVAEYLLEWETPQADFIRRIALCYCQIMIESSAGETLPAYRSKALANILEKSSAGIEGL